MQRFDAAPWPISLKVVSTVAALVLVGVTCVPYRAVPRGSRVPFAEGFGTFVFVVPLAFLLVALCFLVRGYELDGTGFYVERLLWRARIDLGGLTRAWHDPSAMRRSLRLFGNGGLFSVPGRLSCLWFLGWVVEFTLYGLIVRSVDPPGARAGSGATDPVS